MEYIVREVHNRRAMSDFLRLPRLIYCDDPHWVQPLDAEVRRTLDAKRNPYFIHASLNLFVCYAGRDIVARTALIINHNHERKYGVRSAFFGFFESVDDRKAVKVLFEAVIRHCRSGDVELLEGPFNPNHYSELGMQIDRFDTPVSFFQTHNPAYYPALLEGIGFRRAAVLFTGRNDRVREFIKNRYGNHAPFAPSQGFTVRHLDPHHLEADLEKMRSVFNDAFSSNWHFLDVSAEEYRFSAKFLSLVADPEMVVIVEHEGNAVGVLMCVLDINPLLKDLHGKVGPLGYLRFRYRRSTVRKLIVYAVGIRKNFQRSCVYKALLDAMCRMAVNFEAAETTWMSPKNLLAVRAAERLGMTEDKHFAVYEMPLDKGGVT